MKVTFLNSIRPLKEFTFLPLSESIKISGYLSITSYAIFPATRPSVIALRFGVASPKENTPNTTPKKQAKISPEE